MLDDAYIAGLLDGEGSIMLLSNGPGRNRSLVLSVGMSDEPIIDALTNSRGGFKATKRHALPRQTMYYWNLKGLAAQELLETLRPLLVIQRRRALADLVLDDSVLWHRRKGPGTSKVAHAEEVSQAMRLRNEVRLPLPPEVEPSNPSKADLAYLAGILDGEGYVSFEARRIEVFSTDPELPAWLASKFGGGVYLGSRGQGARRTTWRWVRSPTGCTWATRVADLMLLDRKASELRQMQGFGQ